MTTRPTSSAAAFHLPGDGPSVLLLHGYTGSPYELRPVAEALAAAGCAVTVPLLPGHGTRPEDLSPLRWEDFSAAARTAFAAACPPSGGIFVGGLSMGGLLALELASDVRSREGVRGVLAYACALRFPLGVTVFLSALRLLGGHLPDLYAPKKALDLQDPVLASASPSYRTRPLRSARELRVGQRNVLRALPSVTAPLLAVHGLLDRTCPYPSSIDLVRGVGSTDASLVLLPRSGHQVTIDRDRALVGRQSVAFVTSHA